MSLDDAVFPEKLKDREYEKGVIAAGVAEMDFALAPEVRDVLFSHVRHGCVGYLHDELATRVRAAARAWLSDRYHWNAPAAEIRLGPDTVALMHWTLHVLSSSGAALLLPEPHYPRIRKLAVSCGMDVRLIRAEFDERGYQLCLEDLESAYRGSPRSVLFLCNPHNPTGKTVQRGHLRAISEVVSRHGGLVIADEVHAPLVYEQEHHVPYASVSDAAAAHAVTVMSASKGWNLAGLKCAQIVFTNPAHAAAWDSHGFAETIENSTSTLGAAAAVAAYTSGTSWLTSTVEQLRENAWEVTGCVSELPLDITCETPEASYLAWLDFGDAESMKGLSPARLLLDRGAVGVLPGEDFGQHAQQCLRLNFGTSGPRLQQMLDRIRSCFAGWQ